MQSNADTLLSLATNANLFRDANGETYADIVVEGHRETWALSSSGFKAWLRTIYFETQCSAIPPASLNQALQTLIAMAERKDIRPVYIRVARHNGSIFVDLADDEWRAVKISATGRKIVGVPPVRFLRRNGMRQLPRPRRGGRLQDMFPYLGGLVEEDFPLLMAWACAVLRGKRPYPVLAISGPQGSGKSTAINFLSSLIDPSGSHLRPLPPDERSLFSAGTRGLLLAFDNLSGISDGMSDALCRMATGGTFSTRIGGSGEDIDIELCRPIILSGITSLFGKPDLVDRAMFIRFAALDKEDRSEEKLAARFQKDHAKLLGALFDALAAGLKNFPQTKAIEGARMADALKFAVACETAYQPAGTLSQAHKKMRERTAYELTDSDAVAEALIALAQEKGQYRGTATMLLQELLSRVSENLRDRRWPKSTNALSSHLKRIGPALLACGIEVYFLGPEGHDRQRMIKISLAHKTAVPRPSRRVVKPKPVPQPGLFDGTTRP